MLTEGFTGWSFQIGLGGPTTALMGDLTSLLIQFAGPENILSTRIFVYLAKLTLGGAFFLCFARILSNAGRLQSLARLHTPFVDSW